MWLQAGRNSQVVSMLLWLLRGSKQWEVAAAAATALGEMGGELRTRSSPQRGLLQGGI